MKRAWSRFQNGLPPVLGPVLKIGVRQFCGPFCPLARTAYKTGWVPFSKRAEGRFGTRLGNWGAPVFKAVLVLYVKHSQKRAVTRFENGTQPVLAAIFN
jgi:hypothetical protein